ncbi:MAG: aldo/keto reductase [Clostridiales bacterium]|nr:aldo/keto reductase [Clostridiales bacterium]
MHKAVFGNNGLTVSPLGLGTAQYGTGVEEKEAFWQLDRYTECGNLIDTAHVYGDWMPGERYKSERVIGRWLKASGKRESVVISTKCAHPPIGDMTASRLGKAEIVKDVDESLSALGTDCIDILFLHRDDVSMPVDEILFSLEQLRGQGKIRYYGCSNWTLDRIKQAGTASKKNGFAGFSCNQLMWSLARADKQNVKDKTLVAMDEATFAFHASSGLAAMGYNALANGYFTKKSRGEAIKPGVSAKYDTPQNARTFEKLKALSLESGLDITVLSLLYFSAQPFPAVPLVSYSGRGQMEEALKVLETEPSQELLKALAEL